MYIIRSGGNYEEETYFAMDSGYAFWNQSVGG